jgi:hypothetical protein
MVSSRRVVSRLSTSCTGVETELDVPGLQEPRGTDVNATDHTHEHAETTVECELDVYSPAASRNESVRSDEVRFLLEPAVERLAELRCDAALADGHASRQLILAVESARSSMLANVVRVAEYADPTVRRRVTCCDATGML